MYHTHHLPPNLKIHTTRLRSGVTQLSAHVSLPNYHGLVAQTYDHERDTQATMESRFRHHIIQLSKGVQHAT
jgi:hypothetical protein